MTTKTNFEKSLNQLEQIVSELEAQDQPIEKALKKFEDGIKLSKLCNKILDETEKKITILMEDKNGKTIEKPFSENT